MADLLWQSQAWPSFHCWAACIQGQCNIAFQTHCNSMHTDVGAAMIERASSLGAGHSWEHHKAGCEDTQPRGKGKARQLSEGDRNSSQNGADNKIACHFGCCQQLSACVGVLQARKKVLRAAGIDVAINGTQH